MSICTIKSYLRKCTVSFSYFQEIYAFIRIFSFFFWTTKAHAEKNKIISVRKGIRQCALNLGSIVIQSDACLTRLKYFIAEIEKVWSTVMNSAIHKAAVQPAAVQNGLWRSFLLAAPIDSQWTLFSSTGIIPGKPVEQPSTVKLLALWIAL